MRQNKQELWIFSLFRFNYATDSSSQYIWLMKQCSMKNLLYFYSAMKIVPKEAKKHTDWNSVCTVNGEFLAQWWERKITLLLQKVSGYNYTLAPWDGDESMLCERFCVTESEARVWNQSNGEMLHHRLVTSWLGSIKVHPEWSALASDSQSKSITW